MSQHEGAREERGARRAMGAALLASGVAALAPPAAPSAAPPDVLVVRSSTHPSFGVALTGMRASCRCEPTVVELAGDELGDARLIGDALGQRPRITVALGSLATELVAFASPGSPFLSGLASAASEDVPGARGVRGYPDEDVEVDQILKLGPRVGRIGVLHDPAESRTAVERLERAVRKRGLSWVAAGVTDPATLPRALAGIVEDVDALVVMPDRAVIASREAMAHLVLRSVQENVLLYTRSEPLVKGGALFTLVVDPKEVGELLGKMIAEVLRGESSVADLPWKSPRFRLMLNHKTGRALGLALPDDGDAGDIVMMDAGAGSGPLAGFVPAKVTRSTTVPRPAGAAPGEAMVVLRARISEKGKLLESTVLSGEPPFTGAASSAVAAWSFAPATENGAPVPSSLVLTVSFPDGR